MQRTRTIHTTTRSTAALSVRAQLMAELQRAEITARIKEARVEAGLSQPEMADLLDVAPRTYQNYEASRVPWGLIGRIADATGKSTEWLLHGVTPPPQEPTADLMAALDARTKADSQSIQALHTKVDVLMSMVFRLVDPSQGEVDRLVLDDLDGADAERALEEAAAEVDGRRHASAPGVRARRGKAQAQ